ncbi:hypothetical protein LOTGIDRAFT_165207 [Lottia gigantea]|uniref:Uncharacterized protein n=1 Tax=Lottia gigantea TaxID=225164 RepID=V3ZCJ4_LOTGI|nr:hypothetical protein LOTGIDRAFT_165207 [Lottia gigantea]ESO88793.1 hypothetical protein LOTGIDRAFT_165207 [Lottia gigantea]
MVLLAAFPRTACLIVLVLTFSLLHIIDCNITESVQKLNITNTNHCTVSPADRLFRDQLLQLLKAGVKMFDFDLEIKYQPRDILESKRGNIIRWNHWIKTVDNRGRSLLMLDDNYELLSLNSMKMGLKQLNVSLVEDPLGCVRKLSAEDTADLLRRAVLNDFQRDPPVITEMNVRKPTQSVCNMHIKDNNGEAKFLYECCHYIERHELVCSDVEKDSWMGVLVVLVISVKIILVLFSPLLIPESLYREKFIDAEYHHHVLTDSTGRSVRTIKVVATRDPENYQSDNAVVKLDHVQGMEYLKTILNNLDNVYKMELDDIRLSVSAHRLLPENKVPVGILRYFYNHLCRCKIRNVKAFATCCASNIFANFGFRSVKWYRCLVPFMKVVQMFLILLPWILRIVIFFQYERYNEVYRGQRAAELGLKMGFTGSFTVYLTPLHSLFILCYVVLLLDAIVYGVISLSVKEKLKRVTMKCLRAMRETSKLNVCSWSIELLLAPFTSCGILGLLLAAPYWFLLIPFLFIVLLFYFIPTINFIVRMLIHFFIFLCPEKLALKLKILMARTRKVNNRLKLDQIKEEDNFERKEYMTNGDLIFQYIVIIICIISFLSLTFLVMECISFFVEMAVYTSIGIIINAQTALKYLSVASLLILYAKDCFGKLHTKYLAFHKVIAGQLLAKEKELIEETARADSLLQENTVFRVRGEENTNPDVRLIVKDEKIRWDTSGFLIFLDKQDKPFFPEKFFFQVIEMKYHGCPGPLYVNIYRAFKEFLKIIIFLIFVIIVIMAFGDMYSISSTNQMIATGAGGLLPFVFRHFFANKGDITFDVNSIQFKAEFNRVLTNFKQTWPVFDIIPMNCEKKSSSFSVMIDTSTDEFLDATGNVDNNNTINDTEALATSSRHSQIFESEDENKVDLVVDVSNFSERYRAKLTNKRLDGSLTMLAETHRDYESHKMVRNNNYEV